jgi:hypothetical protein
VTVPFHIVLGYGCGAAIALVARRSLVRTQEPARSRYFAVTSLFAATTFAPTGVMLYGQYPDWMLMYLANPAHLPRAFMVPLILFAYFAGPLIGFMSAYRMLAEDRIGAVRGTMAIIAALLASIVVLGRERILTVAYYDAFHGRGQTISIFDSPLLIAAGLATAAIVGVWIAALILVRRHAKLEEHLPEPRESSDQPFASRLGLSGPMSDADVKSGHPVGGDVRP